MEHTLTALTTNLSTFAMTYGLWIGFIILLAILVASATMAGRQVEQRKMLKLTKAQFMDQKKR